MIFTARGGRTRFPTSLVVLTACSPSPAQPSMAIQDSAGVQIVTSLRSAWEEESDIWMIDDAHSLEIPGDFGAPDHYLFQARNMHRMQDGRLVVGNTGARQLLVFDSQGDFVKPVGQPGQGPGEFQGLFGLFACAGDTIVVDEGARISIWDSNLSFVRNQRTAGRLVDGRSNIRGISGDCSSGLFPSPIFGTQRTGQGVYRLPTSLHWATLDGLARDTIARFGGVETYPWTISGQSVDTRLPYGKEGTWATSGNHLFLGLEDQFEIEVFDRLGRLTQIVRWGADPDPVTAADLEFYAEGRQRYIDQYPEEAPLYAPVDHFPIPDNKPTYSRLLADDEGNLWVQRFGRYSLFEPETHRGWWVFDPTGRWLGDIEMPEGLDVRTIQDGLVIGIALDDNDVQHIRFHAIHR